MKSLKAQARTIYFRRVCRKTFISRVTTLGATTGTAKVWWQQFKTFKAPNASA